MFNKFKIVDFKNNEIFVSNKDDILKIIKELVHTRVIQDELHWKEFSNKGDIYNYKPLSPIKLYGIKDKNNTQYITSIYTNNISVSLARTLTLNGISCAATVHFNQYGSGYDINSDFQKALYYDYFYYKKAGTQTCGK